MSREWDLRGRVRAARQPARPGRWHNRTVTRWPRKERSPKRITLDKHSFLTDLTQRSAWAFRFGLVRRAARYTQSVPARSSPSRRSVVCIIATSDARLSLSSRQ
jgi:hypothetical protein